MLGEKLFLDFFYEVTLNTLGDTEAYQCDPEMNLKYDYEFYNLVATTNEKEFNCTIPFHPPTTSELSGRLIDICNNSRSGKKLWQIMMLYGLWGPIQSNVNHVQ